MVEDSEAKLLDIKLSRDEASPSVASATETNEKETLTADELLDLYKEIEPDSEEAFDLAQVEPSKELDENPPVFKGKKKPKKKKTKKKFVSFQFTFCFSICEIC